MSDAGQFTPDPTQYRLRLFIAGSTPRSRNAVENLRRICASYLGDGVEIEVVDIYQHPELADANQIVAAPTLLRVSPLPLRQIVGDLSDEARVLRGLGLSDANRIGDEHDA